MHRSALAVLLLLALPVPASAWGRLGHRVIARLAERHVRGPEGDLPKSA